MSAAITLRYFNARGRAQFLRYYLRVRNVAFTDERVQIDRDFASWMKIRDDASVTGPFHKLPVAQIGDTPVAETLVIAEFLHRQFGDAGLLDSQTDLRHRQLISSLYNDVTTPMGMLLWAEIAFAGLDFEAFATRTFERVQQHMQNIERALGEWHWHELMEQRRIMLADCLLWECIDVCRTVFGRHLEFESLPILAAIHSRYAAGTAFSELLSEFRCPITARDNEPEVIDRIQALLAT